MALKKIDMSPEAVASRIDDLRALYRLMLSLREVKILGPVSTAKANSGS